MSRRVKNMGMDPVDKLFEIGDTECDAYSDSEKIQQIPIEQLFPFHDHPFKVVDDEKMIETKKSIAKCGVLVPTIARLRDGGGYELISGHRRKMACELLGIPTLPVIIRKVDDDEATITMVDSNIQRENLLFSEKAFAYKMKLQALKHQGIKNCTSRQVGEKLSVEMLSENSNDSARNIHRYIRLTELIPNLLDSVDNRKIAFNTAVEISYLKQAEQQILMEKMTKLKVVPSMSQVLRLKKYSSDGGLLETVIDAILTEETKKKVQVTLKGEKLNRYFPKNYSQKQIEETIIELLEQWHIKNGLNE